MKEKVIKVLRVDPHEPPKVVSLENNLAALQKAVSVGASYTGLIEIVSLDAETCILCNEEGKLIGLEPNRRLGSDVLCGVFYVVGQNKQGELTSLPQETMQQYAKRFAVPEEISIAEVERTLRTEFYVC